jgi:alanyl-tRNA synthetase
MSGNRPVISSANDLRKAFEGFFASKAHTVVPSASLIPHDPTVLFTVAGMVPFKPYFVGDEAAPFKRAVTVQKCTRAGGKHNDLDEVGRTKRHLVFFEMMGNFSFGDYFKSDAIPWAWELVTEVFGFDGDRLWITVHESDDEAEQIWHEVVGVPMSRIQRLGDEDNFWQMGDAGPCGPCSEIHIDRGPAFGPEGGPLHDPHGDRYMEFWNLVFMQYNQSKDGSRTPLPKPSIDTGAGLERILALMQGTDSVWETDVLFPMIESAQSLTSKKYKIGDYDDRDSFSLRVLAEHARSSMMLVNDGVFPSNENRGYVLRRIIRRAVRHAYLLGTEKLVMPTLAETAISVMSGAYPDLLTNKDFIINVLSREEERFRQTLKTGLTILEGELSTGAKTMSGSTAFTLHDTYGFPIELTEEIAGERNVQVDVEGFGREMQEQRDRAKSARKGSSVSAATVDSYREVMEQFGTTNFVGYGSNQCEATVLSVLQNVEAGPNMVEVFLDVSPFYAESGGQVGDTGTIRTESGELQVLDTTFALPGLRRHTCSVVNGSVEIGQSAKASINVVARDATRRNHTATHMLHWALRQVLGDHVKQAGSHVSPERLRFDFSHYAPVSASEIEAIERLTNEQLIANGPVRAYETSKDEATAAGAIAFFGDKYGDIVRVLEAGVSVELCGGTHVGALGDIGMVKVIAESSIGSNLRRIEAVTGTNAVEHVLSQNRMISAAASLLGAQSSELVVAIQRKIDENKSLGEELKSLRSAQATSRASEMAASAQGGVVISRVDGVTPNDLRELALAIRQNPTIRIVVLGGVTDTGGVALVATVSSAESVPAGDLIRDAAKAVGGGGGGKGDIATAGGKDPSAIDAALDLARSAVAKVIST